MTHQYNIPDVAVKYILYQRTQYLTLANTFLAKAIRKIIPSTYTGLVAYEAKSRNSQIKKMYLSDMEREYRSIEQHLPAHCKGILDIGCGVAGIDIFLSQHYADQELEIFLLDKSRLEQRIHYDFEAKGAFYNSLSTAQEILATNGVNASKIHLLEATDSNDIAMDERIDLTLSLISWGFHYPVNTYLARVYELLNEGGVLILDVRKGTDGIESLRRLFESYEVILETSKYLRVCARKQPVQSYV